AHSASPTSSTSPISRSPSSRATGRPRSGRRSAPTASRRPTRSSSSSARRSRRPMSEHSMTGAILVRLREPSRLRNIEAPLLAFAILLGAGAVALVDIAAAGALDASLWWPLGGLALLLLVLHVVLR